MTAIPFVGEQGMTRTMARLEDLTRGATIRGTLPERPVVVLDVKWLGTAAVDLSYKDAAGRPGNEPLYRDNEPPLEVVAAGRPGWRGGSPWWTVRSG